MLTTFHNYISKIKKITFDQYINYLIIGYAFVLPISKAGIVFFTYLMILSFLVKGDFSSIISKLKESKIIVILFLFLSLSLISVIWSSDKFFALIYIKKYYHLLVIPIIYLTLDKKYVKHIFTAFLSGMLLSEIMSYAIFFELITYKDILPSNPSPFMNHINYSYYLSFSSMILLNRFFFAEKRKYQIFYFLYFLTTVSNLFLNGGRTGQVVFIVTIFVMLYLNFKNKVMSVVISTLLIVTIVSTAYTVSPVFKVRGTQAYHDISNALINKNYSQSFGIRVSLWIMGANVFRDNLLLGTGIGDEKTGMQKYADKYNIVRYKNIPDKGHIDYHNMYLQHAVQLGISGILLMVYLVYSIFKIKFKSLIYRNINIAFATSVLLTATTGNLLHTLFPMAFFSFFVALLSAISKDEHHY